MTQEEIIKMANDAELCHEIWIDNDDEVLDTLVKFAKLIAQAEREACLEKQEPVAWQWLNTAHFRKRLPKDAEKGAWNPLYIHPQPKREPLTDEQIEKIIKANMSLQMNLAGIRQDFEAAHGIKGEA